MSAQSGLLPDSYRKVLRFARRRVGSIEDAEDVTQEVYANAAAALNGRGAEAPTLAWLYAVAKRRLADEARRGNRSRTIPLERVGEPTAVSAEYGSEVAAALSAGLASMPEGQRRVVVGRLLQVGASPTWATSWKRARRRAGCDSCAASNICARSSRKRG